MNVKFSLNSNILSALETSLSVQRMATYVSAVGGDKHKALSLYNWNTAISAAFYGPLQGLEVALRNALNTQLTVTYGRTWFDNPVCCFDVRTLKRIADAKREVVNAGTVDPGRLIAALSFGFWVALLSRGGDASQVGMKQDYEKTLWRPALYKAFPQAKLSRKAAHTQLDYLRTFRNRIAHHEPIFTRHLAADYQAILTITGWMNTSMRDWIDHHSRVSEVLAVPRDTVTIRF